MLAAVAGLPLLLSVMTAPQAAAVTYTWDPTKVPTPPIGGTGTWDLSGSSVEA